MLVQDEFSDFILIVFHGHMHGRIPATPFLNFNINLFLLQIKTKNCSKITFLCPIFPKKWRSLVRIDPESHFNVNLDQKHAFWGSNCAKTYDFGSILSSKQYFVTEILTIFRFIFLSLDKKIKLFWDKKKVGPVYIDQ